ncbi:hypothetical protein FNZ56_12115 [Pseudoluteimonas lycopersici]|uniref:Tetratricopeptide repeat protein n=1 Tax=Pseudoluteimonas lycopersici TaxID=1324796 RepID=A0A516V7Q2_9GAMM|nr:hypothetical protein [Lysobacter lycopersici]QDQ74572.1 hypothetical protein FNZ56_12115 [Lysobacter lycopersici]
MASAGADWRIWAQRATALALWLLLALPLLRVAALDRLWPQDQVLTLLEHAQDALDAGRLTAVDGSGARELYTAAIAMDPDRGEAREGLARVALAAAAQARDATSRNRFDQARRMLDLARELDAPRAAVEPVADALRKREASRLGIDTMLRNAAAARVAGNLDGAPDAALPLYAKVLSLQPERTDAIEGREDALADLLQRARAELDAGKLADAAALISTARGYDAGHVDLPETEAAFARSRDALQSRADAALRRGKLVDAERDYRQLAALPDAPASAKQGLHEVALAQVRNAEKASADFHFDRAAAALDRARAIDPATPGLREARAHLARARVAQRELRPAPVGAKRQREVQQLLAQAAAAEARGDLLTPPGDSAFDRLRVARSLAPDDKAVIAASKRLLPAAWQCQRTQLQANSLARSRSCLDAAAALGADRSEVNRARRALALRWVDVGEERLRGGDVDSAGQAVEEARRLDASVPGIAELQERVRVAARP